VGTYRVDGWTALGDPTRRAIFDRPAGTRRIYQLDPDGVGALRAELDRFWNKSLAAYKAVVEQPTEEAQ
jgi:hypothetical protein